MKGNWKFVIWSFFVTNFIYMFSRTMDVLMGGIGERTESLFCSAILTLIVLFMFFIISLYFVDRDDFSGQVQKRFLIILNLVQSYFIYGLLFTLFTKVKYDGRLDKVFKFMVDAQGLFLFATVICLFISFWVFAEGHQKQNPNPGSSSRKMVPATFGFLLLLLNVVTIYTLHLQSILYNPFWVR